MRSLGEFVAVVNMAAKNNKVVERGAFLFVLVLCS